MSQIGTEQTIDAVAARLGCWGTLTLPANCPTPDPVIQRASFDHLSGEQEHCRRDRDAERLRGL